MTALTSNRMISVDSWKRHIDWVPTKRALIFAVLIFALSGDQYAQRAPSQETNEEKAQELIALENKTHTFQEFLSGNPEVVTNEKKIFALTSDAKVKRRIASILITLGIKDRVYFDYLVQEAKKA